MRCLPVALCVVSVAACRDAPSEQPEIASKTRLTGGSASASQASQAKSGDPFLVFDTTAPRVGDVAPTFTLNALTGERVDLRDTLSRGPAVLVFASFTCPPSRMKLPGFEALASRWSGRASVHIVYGREAHPRAKGSVELNGFATQVEARDANRDSIVTVAEYGDLGPRYMFDAFDLNHDGEVRSHEFLAARRLREFSAVDDPTTLQQRMALARRLRTAVPGSVPLLIDDLDNTVVTAYGGLPNMAYIIGQDRRVAFKIPWAAVADIERKLAQLTGSPVPTVVTGSPDLKPVRHHIAAAHAQDRALLIKLVASGCQACVTLSGTLAESAVREQLEKYHLVEISIDDDAGWRLFESFGLAATPALVAFTPTGGVRTTLQGAQPSDRVQSFLRSQ